MCDVAEWSVRKVAREGEDAVQEPQNGSGGVPDGLVVVGRFIGVKGPRPYTRDDGTQGTSRPKLGVEAADGTKFQVACTDATMAEWNLRERGTRIALPVSARGPFGSRGAVRLTVRGDEGEPGDDFI